jgi:CRP-like cAMP-binding protein
MSDFVDQIRSLTEAVHPLPPDALETFARIWQPFDAARKEVLTSAGDKEKYLYFVLEGVQRVYYADDQGREATLVFTYAPSFGGVLDALMQQSPSRYYFETLTPSKFLRAPVEKLFAAMQAHPDLELLVRKGITGALSGVLERLAEVQSFSAEDRFRSLLKRSPHILQLVPHKYLANYLGMDATNFSKLINRVKI